MFAGGRFGFVEVIADEHHLSAEGSHPLQLERVRSLGSEHSHINAFAATTERKRLAPVAGACSHDRHRRPEAFDVRRNERGRASTFEAADRIQRLHLDRHSTVQPLVQRSRLVQRRVTKRGIDQIHSFGDPLRIEPAELHTCDIAHAPNARKGAHP